MRGMREGEAAADALTFPFLAGLGEPPAAASLALSASALACISALGRKVGRATLTRRQNQKKEEGKTGEEPEGGRREKREPRTTWPETQKGRDKLQGGVAGVVDMGAKAEHDENVHVQVPRAAALSAAFLSFWRDLFGIPPRQLCNWDGLGRR